MSELNPAQAALSRWMRPPVARSWIAQITRYSSHRETAYRRDLRQDMFRTLLSRDWITIDFAR